MYYFLKDCLLGKLQLPQSSNKNDWEQWKKKREKKQSWKLTVSKINEQAEQSISTKAAEQHLKFVFEKTKKQL